ncbi:MAG TPA: adenylosuccinate lyase [SAR86 cluster bacterium]|nr:adenylosuccinate lyase [SAR86 cluster bacterium]
MKNDSLLSISPLDGRYNAVNSELRYVTSEYGLIKYRLFIEIEWFKHLANTSTIKELPKLSNKNILYLDDLIKNFSLKDAKRVKTIEKRTNHDVKAIEYYLKEKFSNIKSLDKYSEFIHFACTSEDINNLSYSLMIKDASKIISLNIEDLIKVLKQKALKYSNTPMLSRTHGQTASPTTMGKEFANFVHRISSINKSIKGASLKGKINGAVGNFNAHTVAYPDVNWEIVSRKFIKGLGLKVNTHTTQVEPKDSIAELFSNYVRLNNVLIDFSRDIWGYISLGYFKQKLKKGEIGSSTMPHKVNPIDFENAEGNLGLANSSFQHLSNTIVISRWQRDLTDSTVMRNIGVCYGHTNLALSSLLRGIYKLEINKDQIKHDLDSSWEVLTEAMQTIFRKHLIKDGYELMKELSRGKKISKKDLHHLIDKIDIPSEEKQVLKSLTPSSYTGIANTLAKELKDS